MIVALVALVFAMTGVGVAATTYDGGTKAQDSASNRGPRGKQGPRGKRGKTGKTGPVGPRGLQGVQGVQGVPGPQGVPGVPGATGSVGTVTAVTGNLLQLTSTGPTAVGVSTAVCPAGQTAISRGGDYPLDSTNDPANVTYFFNSRDPDGHSWSVGVVNNDASAPADFFAIAYCAAVPAAGFRSSPGPSPIALARLARLRASR